MNEEATNRFVNLCNALRLFAFDFEGLIKLDGPSYDVEFELATEFDTGLTPENIGWLSSNDIISSEVKNMILDFRDHLLLIPDSFWTVDELKSNAIWDRIRIRANEILDILGIQNKEYDFSVIKIV